MLSSAMIPWIHCGWYKLQIGMSLFSCFFPRTKIMWYVFFSSKVLLIRSRLTDLWYSMTIVQLNNKRKFDKLTSDIFFRSCVSLSVGVQHVFLKRNQDGLHHKLFFWLESIRLETMAPKTPKNRGPADGFPAQSEHFCRRC